MQHLRVLLWNDRESDLRKWALVVKEMGCEVEQSNAPDADDVVKVFNNTQPDVVILDIMYEGSGPRDKGRGIKIAEAIRKVDRLVPILAVTRDPEVVYLKDVEFHEVQFAGVYDATVMAKGVFGPIALRPSLNYWHLIAPEFALVRRCVQHLREIFGGQSEKFVRDFEELLCCLPYSRSVESWHNQVCTPIRQMLSRHGIETVADRFDKMARLFQQADPFYMAGSNSRRHLSHNVQVFLIGLLLLLGCEPILNAAIIQLRDIRNDLSREDAIIHSILLWACIANTHDAAYLSQHLSEVTKKLAALSEEFLHAFEKARNVTPLTEARWPSDAHGQVAAALWKAGECLSDIESGYVNIISSAIANHDVKSRSKSVVEMTDWSSFLAIAADEVQEWGRDRPAAPPGVEERSAVGWALFSLEGVRVLNSTTNGKDKWEIDLTFIAQDYRRDVSERFGRLGTDKVRNTFADIARKLRSCLQSNVPMKITFTIEFVSRQGTAPVVEPVEIGTTPC